MSCIVVSSFENLDTGDLQAQGESITVLSSEDLARSHFVRRTNELDAAARAASDGDATSIFIAWVAILAMPLDVASVDEALEDLETIVEESEADEGHAFDELVVDYMGVRYQGGQALPYERSEALSGLQGWLS